MSTNLFPCKYLKGQVYQADEIWVKLDDLKELYYVRSVASLYEKNDLF